MSKNIPGVKEELQQELNEIELDRKEFREKTRWLLAYVWQRYNVSKYKQEILKARDLFFAVRPDEELNPAAMKQIDRQNFRNWFLCDYRLIDENETPMHHFLENDAGVSLPDLDKKIAHDLAHSRLSMYDVISTDPETSDAVLREIFTLTSVNLQDERIAKLGEGRYFYGLRLIKSGENLRSAGDMYIYPEPAKEKILLIIQSSMVDPGALVPDTIDTFLKDKGHIFNGIQLNFRNTDELIVKKEIPEEEPVLPPKKEEPVVAAGKSHFSVKDMGPAKEALENMDSTLFDRKEKEKFYYKWFRKAGSQDEDGKLILSKRKLVLETFGEDNLDAGKSAVMKNLKDYVEHMYDELEKRRSALRR